MLFRSHKQEFAEYLFKKEYDNTDIGDIICKERGKVYFKIIKPNDTLIMNWVCDDDKIIK